MKSRIFIGRRGKRNIKNYDQVSVRLKCAGFNEVFPHTLPLWEKICLFSNAEYVVGPASSGFTNVIFCDAATSVTMFINPSRHLDPLLTKYCSTMGIKLSYILGEEEGCDKNADFYVDMDELELYLEAIGVSSNIR